MASTSPQQIVSQSSVLFKFEVPSYDSYPGSTVVDVISDLSTQGPSTPFAGLLGPTSRAPRLVPLSKAPIDIKNDFAWTSSKADPARADMPYVYLTEKIVDRSSRLQNLMYNTASLLQSPLGTGLGAAFGAGAAAKIARNRGATGALLTGAKVVGAVGGAAGSSLLSNLADSGVAGDSYSNNLRAFSGLYSSTPTQFAYKLPFVKTTGSISKSISQNWNEDSTSFGEGLEAAGKDLEDIAGSVGPIAGAVTGGLENASLMAQTAEEVNRAVNQINKSMFAAAYTESAKTFSYGNVPSFDISFYLFNNLTWADTVKNWYAVFALQYQNLPNRLNRLILTPSVIYEAVVPGYFYSMYTFIKNINVSFIGSNLLIDIPVIQSNISSEEVRDASTGESAPVNSTVKVIVPEVYKIDISFESLVPESQNLLYEAITQTRSNGGVPSITQTATAPSVPGTLPQGF